MRELEREPPDQALSPICVVGRGRVGGAIAAGARHAGLDVRHAGREDLAGALDGATAALLCVPDAAIAGAAAALAEAGAPPLVGHTSGATTLDALGPALGAGTEAFSLHPLQTVPDPGAPLTGAPAAVAGSSPAAEAFAAELAGELGMRPFRVPEESRAAYHAAAAVASNLLIALEESAAGLMEAAGIEDARELLAPLVLRTASNWADRGAEALTGPIARGDEETLGRHEAAIRELRPDLEPAWRALCERARDVARRVPA